MEADTSILRSLARLADDMPCRSDQRVVLIEQLNRRNQDDKMAQREVQRELRSRLAHLSAGEVGTDDDTAHRELAYRITRGVGEVPAEELVTICQCLFDPSTPILQHTYKLMFDMCVLPRRTTEFLSGTRVIDFYKDLDCGGQFGKKFSGIAMIGTGVTVSKSRIEGAGRGLFADRKFLRGETITLYDGIIRYYDDVRSWPPHTLTHMRNIGRHVVVEGLRRYEVDLSEYGLPLCIALPLQGRGGGSFANDHANPNARYTWDDMQRCCFLEAIQDIESGDEIYCWYGSRYSQYGISPKKSLGITADLQSQLAHDPSTPCETWQRALEIDGYLVIHDVVDPGNCSAVLEWLCTLQSNKWRSIFNDGDGKRFEALLSPIETHMPSEVMDILQNTGQRIEQLLSQVSCAPKSADFAWTALKSEAGCRRQPAHCDYQPVRHGHGKEPPSKRSRRGSTSVLQQELPLVVLVAIQCSTSIVIWPGSSALWETFRGGIRVPIKPIKVQVPVGAVLLMQGTCVHGGDGYGERNFRLHAFWGSTAYSRAANMTFLVANDPEVSEVIEDVGSDTRATP